ncbi:acetoin utilization protein AcuC [Cellulomonas carbonis]|uniref:Acetoin utilization protein AcuC n=1 Tax=Cellulomonas carbonis T26 TaxID=947969 RepID=A0A0A0BXB1_9CELL|nr:acetoin utilization protein AcuC [Cellulomonas carbonis]KGM11774.1 acetoin utilization protein AcuC [Cellulomonas carbonis T26]GGC09036.1 acetoin utilization protein AcuC [Cellulomonas carbonis]
MLTRVVWSPELLRYDFGPGHPMTPLRLDLTHRLASALGVLDAPDVEVVAAEPASDDVLALAHDPGYVKAVRVADETGDPDPDHGLGTTDDPCFPGMHDASARVVAGSVEAAEALWRGDVVHAVNVAGGMHHAMRDHAAGFCVYNDAVAAIRRLLDLGAHRVAYLDLDAHHGDGVEAAFWDDPRVLTVSVHESPLTLFPGTGHPTDVGGPHARGTVVNVALPAGTSGVPWLRAVEAVVLPVARAFAPDVVVSQHGCDAHGMDPLTHLDVSVDAQRRAAERVHELAHDVCDGRWLALGGGGYAVASVVPRVWTHLLAIAAHAPLDPATRVPDAWLDHVDHVTGQDAPTTMTDDEDPRPRPWADGYDPADDVDRVILAARRAVFDWYDLDPLYD